MTPRFLPSCTTAHEEIEELSKAIPGARFWTDLTADLIAMETTHEQPTPTVVLIAERGGDALLSIRRAARRLGVSRTRTLAPAIEAGKVRVVRVGGQQRIPADEVMRLEREGLVRQRSPKPAQRPRSAPAAAPRDLAAELARVRSLKPPART